MSDIYIYCFLSSTFFAYLASRSKNKGVIILCSAISILILSILGGLRHPDLAIDVHVYAYPDFNKALHSLHFLDFLREQNSTIFSELGYKYLCYLSSRISDHPNVSLFMYQLVTVTGFYIGAYRHRKTISLPMMIFMFSFMLYVQTYMLMRQTMACAVIFMGLNHLEEKRYLRFLMYGLFACLFHNSAILFAVYFIFVHMLMTSDLIIKNSMYKISIYMAAILGMCMARPIIMSIVYSAPNLAKYRGYFENASGLRYLTTETTNSSKLTALVQIFAFFLYGKAANKVFVPEGGGGTNFFLFNILFAFAYKNFVGIVGARLMLYIEYANIIALAALPKFVKEKHLKLVVLALVVAYAFLYYYRSVVHYSSLESTGYYHRAYPYRSIL